VGGQTRLPVHQTPSASAHRRQQHCLRLPLKLTLPMPPPSRAAKFNQVYLTPFAHGALRLHHGSVR